MIKLFKKAAILGFCINLALSPIAYAGVLDTITEEDTEQNEILTTYDTKKITFPDISDNWAKDIILDAAKMGLASGYNDGTFRPNNQVTRAEFAKMLNNAMKNESKVNLDFNDVITGDWFYEDVQKAVSVGFFGGYEDNTFRPNAPITRQEAAKVIASTITSGDNEGEGATMLKDYYTIPEWAVNSVNTVANKGYIIGYPEQLYKPVRSLTRAEAVKIIYEIIENENIERGFNLTNYNESYSQAIVVGNLNVLDSVGNGNVYITNVTVLGDIVISAKNVNSVVLTDVSARNIIVENDSNPVKIVCNDNVNIKIANLPSIVIVERKGSNINI